LDLHSEKSNTAQKSTPTNIYDNRYSQFRVLLLEELEKRCKRNPKYSLRTFARFLGTDSSSLSKILNAKREFSRRNIEKFAQKLGLSPQEIRAYIVETSVNGMQSTIKRQGASASDHRTLTEDQFRVLSDWLHVAILEVTKMKSFSSKSLWMSKSLGVSPSEVSIAVERLLRVGMLERNEKNSLAEAKNYTTIGNVPTDASLRKLQQSFLEKASTALDHCDVSRRDHSGVTLAFNSENIQEAKKSIQEFRRWFNKTYSLEANADSVYQLGIQFFPLTKEASADKKPARKKRKEFQ
jgi:uncharacterized protein (TIGR02147 family)